MSTEPVQRQIRRNSADAARARRRQTAIVNAARAFERSLAGGRWQSWDVLQLGSAPLRPEDGKPDAAAGAAKLVSAIQKVRAEYRGIQARLDSMPDAALAVAGMDREAQRSQGAREASALAALAEVIPTLARGQDVGGSAGESGGH